jgi:DNA polymerase-1
MELVWESVTNKRAPAVLRRIERWHGPLGVDTETTGLDWPSGDVVVGIAVATDSHAFYFPVRHHTANVLPRHITRLLRSLELRHLVMYNAQFDMHMLTYEGMRWPAMLDDAMLAAHLVNENRESFKLKKISESRWGPDVVAPQAELDTLLKKNKLKKYEMAKLHPRDVAKYACHDAWLTWRLMEELRPQIAQWKLRELSVELREYQHITFEMEEYGMAVDMERLALLRRRIKPTIAAQEKKLHKMAGRAVNPRSPPQVRALLGTKDTREETLLALRKPIADLIVELRKWSKMETSYCTPYEQLLGDDGALHASLNLAGTVAGRPSCSRPNLQAVARSTAIYRVKDLFVARPGCSLVSADYSQAELRLGAHYAKDRQMMAILNGGGDIHGATATRLGVPRDIAKRINFGIVYGIGARGLSKQIGTAEQVARSALNRWHRAFPSFRRVSKLAEKTARERGYVRLWTGRVQRFDEKLSPPRKAFSRLVQGGVAEIMRHAIVKLHRKLGSDAPMLVQVHDQILFEPKTRIVKKVVPIIRQVMQDFDFSVPPRVDISVGPSWGELKEET